MPLQVEHRAGETTSMNRARRALIAVLLALSPCSVSAQAIRADLKTDSRPDPAFVDGLEDFVTLCANDVTDGSKCSYFLQGVIQTFQMARVATSPNREVFFCADEKSTNLDVVRAVLAYVELHPDTKKMGAPAAIVLALMERFPCKTEPKSARTAQQAEIDLEIQRFAADPAHPYFGVLRKEMATLLQTGKALTLNDAYQQAMAAHHLH
jgi:hypothetical protein